MKTIKSIIFLSILLVGLMVNAQEEKMTLGVKVGLNLSNIGSDKGSYDNTKTKAGFNAGLTLDYAFTRNWYLLTGVEYSYKGVKVELSSNDQHINAAYVQLPVLAGFKIPILEDMALLISTGPYFAYGVHGKIKEGSYKQDTFGDYTLKRFDWGIDIGVAFEWKKFCFTLGGELGMINIMQKNNDKAETRNLTISAGYKF